ncbi:MAG TPA: hypothetical protein VMW74_01730 [Nitrosopumilaceae archaeon]|nr:hypothetical protein [Nitrosopumilaceae archaeon]
MIQNHDAKKVVLRNVIDEKEASAIIEDKKTSVFKSLLKKPKKDDVHVNSIKLFHECLLMVSGKYVADYYRKKVHTISVDSNVQEVIFGGGIFPINEKSGFKRAFVGNRGKNKIDLSLEEHVFVEEEDELVFDHNGIEIKLPFKINSKTVENYPDRILIENSENVRKPKITYDFAANLLKESIKKPLESDIRKLNEEFTVQEITEVYVPIFEARLTGPKNKVGLLRLDAIRKKIL